MTLIDTGHGWYQRIFHLGSAHYTSFIVFGVFSYEILCRYIPFIPIQRREARERNIHRRRVVRTKRHGNEIESPNCSHVAPEAAHRECLSNEEGRAILSAWKRGHLHGQTGRQARFVYGDRGLTPPFEGRAHMVTPAEGSYSS